MISLNWLPEAGFLYILIFARVGTMLMPSMSFGGVALANSAKVGSTIPCSRNRRTLRDSTSGSTTAP